MKFKYDMSSDDEYTDIWVQYAAGDREWEMHLYRDRATLVISKPMYQYSPNRSEPFEEVTRLPKRVQAYFDSVMSKVKTLLILGSN